MDLKPISTRGWKKEQKMPTEELFRKAPEGRKLIFFNGPPQCGKSFGASAVMEFIRANAPWTNVRFMDIAEPMKRAAHALYCTFHSWDYYDTKEGLPEKSLASGDFLGLSPREAYIEMFLDLERRHGPEVLGFIARKRITRAADGLIFVFPNAGRLPELVPLVNTFGANNILVIEVQMMGKTFDGDIRGYIGDAAKEKWPSITVKKIPNVFGDQEDKDFYRMLCEGTVKNFLKIEEKE